MGSSDFPTYGSYSHMLEPGWLYGRLIDDSDLQYRGFRDKIPILTALCIGHVGIGRILRAFLTGDAAVGSKGSRRRGEVASKISLASSLIVAIVLHGAGVLKMLVLLCIPYFMTRKVTELTARIQKQHHSPHLQQSFGTAFWSSGYSIPYGPAFVWIWGISVLFANSYYGGYQFAWISSSLAFLDQWRGMMPRWYMSFNFQVLRMISYSMDHYWAVQSSPGIQNDEGVEKNGAISPKGQIIESKEPGSGSSSNGTPSAKSRVEDHRRMCEYGIAYYLDFCLYLPLYFAGPIITFNDYACQISNRGALVTKQTIVYGIRWVVALFLMESLQHILYVTAIGKGKAWEGLTPFQFMVVGFFSLQFIWLKLLVIWRFFRLWAMLDGIETVENMERCIYNNYSAAGFWRSWHRSYNRWIIRYIYVPFGGSKHRILNSFVTFTFVAFWHDISLNLLAWGWLVVLFIMPEMLITQYFKKPSWQNWPYFRYLCGIGCVMNILLMMLVNLIGFSVGLDGAQALLATFISWKGLVFFSMAFPALFSANQIQFEVRAMEQRQGKSSNNIRY
ncbi:glycerol transporter [Dinochytrium kinnereticum]|nr:glycerol transporter [Dinochytrium kinnereticum]